MQTFLATGLTAGLVIGVAAGAAARPASRMPEEGVEVRLTVSTDRPTYHPGDSVSVGLTVLNPGGPPATLRFATGQRYDVELRDEAARPLRRWSEGRMFTQMMGQERLEPDDSLAYRVTLLAPTTPGRYQVLGRIAALDQVLEASVAIRVE
jgi:hypothetical protein